MKTAKKVLSILIAITMMLSMVSVAATAGDLPDCKATISLTAQKATYTSTGEEKSGRTGKTYSINTVVEYDTTVSDPKNGNALEVEPGDTVCIRMYLQSDYNAGLFQAPIYYSSDLGDAKDIITTSLSREGGMTEGTTLANYQITDAVLKKITGFNDQHLFFFDDPEYGKIADIDAKNTLFTVYSDFANAALKDSRYATILEAGGDFFTVVDNPKYNEATDGNNRKYLGQTADGKTWATSYFTACPITDDGVYTCPMSEEMGNVTTWFLQMPLQIPADAKAGTEYKVMIPAEAAKKTYNPYGLLTLGYIPGEGEVKSSDIQNMEYNYLPTYDLTGATVTLKVKGTTPPPVDERSWDALQSAYDSAPKTNDGTYTAASWTDSGIATALANAKTELDGKATSTSTQDAINALTTALSNAVAALKEKADYSAFDALVGTLEGIAAQKADNDGYDYSAVDSALEAASKISTDLSVDEANVLATFVSTYADTNRTAVDYDITYTVAGALAGDTVTITANTNPATFTVEDAITFDAAKITLSDSNYSVASINPASIAVGTVGAQTVTVNVTKDLSWAGLEAAYNSAPKSNDGTYTNASWTSSGIETALANAASELTNKALTKQDDITALATALDNAVKALKVKADYTEFNNLVSKLEGIAAVPEDGYDYTAVNAALAAAKLISTDLSVDDASILADFVSTYANTDKVAINYTITYVVAGALGDDTVTITANENPTTYTVKNFVMFDAAKVTLNDSNYSVISFNPAVIMNGTIGDKTVTVNVTKDLSWAGLEAAYNSAPKSNDGTYTNASWTSSGIETALANAASELTNKALTKQDDITALATAIDNAVKALKEKADYSEFNNLVSKLEGIAAVPEDGYDYTAVNAALAAAEKISTDLSVDDASILADFVSTYANTDKVAINYTITYVVAGALGDDTVTITANENPTTYTVKNFVMFDAAKVTLNDSNYSVISFNPAVIMNGTIGDKTVTVNVTKDLSWAALQSAYDTAPQSNEDGTYTNASWTSSGIETALANAATELVNHACTTQEAINALATDLNNAAAALKVKADYTEFNALVQTLNGIAAQKADNDGYDYTAVEAALAAAEKISADLSVDDAATLADFVSTYSETNRTAVNYTISYVLVGAEGAEILSNTNAKSFTVESDDVMISAGNIQITEGYRIVSLDTTKIAKGTVGDKTVKVNIAAVGNTDVIDIQTEPVPVWTPATYNVKIDRRAIKFQFVDEDGNTWTYDRNKANVVAYKADGTPANDDYRAVAYEIWTVTTTLPAGNYKVIAKYSLTGWQKDESRNYEFTVTNKMLENTALVSAELNATSGARVPVTATIVVGNDVQKVQLELNGSTVTKTNFTDLGNGTKSITINVRPKKGVNTIYVNTKANNEWANHVATLTYTAE